MNFGSFQLSKLLPALKANWLFLAWFVFILGSVMLIHGLTPKLVGSQTAYYLALGGIECGQDTTVEILSGRCGLTGGDTGGIFPTNSPFVIIGTILALLLPFSVEVIYSLTALIFMTVGIYGAYKLFAVSKSRYLNLFLAGLYMLTPIVLSMRGFGGTYWGVILLPAMLAMGLSLNKQIISEKLRKLNVKNVRRTLLPLGLWILLTIFSLFLDGYTFVMLVASILLVIAAKFIAKSAKFVASVVNAGIVLFASAIAYLIYRSVFPLDGLVKADIDLFRSMGLDVATAVVPNSRTWLSSTLDTGITWTDLWGDGTNAAGYLGLMLMVAAVIGVVISLRNKLSALQYGIIIISIVGFVLALGPSLKFNTKRGPLQTPVTYQSYLMPKSDAVVNFPYEDVYKLPGLSSMRATYRWILLTQIGLIFFAGIGLDKLRQKKYSKTVFIICLLLVLDLAPQPNDAIALNSRRYDNYRQFNSEVLAPARSLLNDEQVIFYPNSRGNNDYLANYLAPNLDIQTFNVGNDKAFNYAKESWPEEVNKLLLDNSISNDEAIDLIVSILKSGTADAIVVPKFDLRWDSYSWPPRNASDRVEIIEQLAKENTDLEITSEYRFSIIRLSE